MRLKLVFLAAPLISASVFVACNRAPDNTETPATRDAPPAEVEYGPACPFEGCQLGRWTAREPVVTYAIPGGSETMRAIEKGATVEAVEGQVRAIPRRATVTAVYKSDEAQGIRLGSIVYALHPIGEGALKVWHDGQIKDGSLDLALRYDEPAQALDWAWWVKVRLPAGGTTWVKNPQGRFDGMDALGR